MNFNQPYMNNYGAYNFPQPMLRQQIAIPQNQPIQPNLLQGRFVESIDIVKNIEIPMDRKC